MLPVLKKRMDELKYILEDDKEMNPKMRKKISTEIEEINHRYNIISSKEELHFYTLNSAKLINDYKKEMNKPIQMNFMGGPVKVDNKTINEIYKKFIKIIRDIYTIKETCIDDTDVCPTCGTSSNYVVNNINIKICMSCGTERDTLHIAFSYKDTDRINISTKYQYDRKIHFRECINQFQGKQNISVKPEVYEKLINHLEIHGLVREGDLPKKIKFEKVTKHHISIFLKEIGFPNHYEDLNLIYHNITGNELDDITHLETILMEDFDKLSKIYDEVYVKTRKITRKNFINTQYVLYQLLKRHKYPCSRNDFSFLKTIERKGFHDDICSDLFEKLGWSFKSVF
jgi:hypothetical protein